MTSVFAGPYDPKKVTFVFAGTVLTGWGDSSMLSIEPSADVATAWTGATGQKLFVRSADTGATVTASIHQASPDNAVLEAHARAFTIAPIEIRDNNTGRVLCRGNECVVAKRPTRARGASITVGDWQFIVANAQGEV